MHSNFDRNRFKRSKPLMMVECLHVHITVPVRNAAFLSMYSRCLYYCVVPYVYQVHVLVPDVQYLVCIFSFSPEYECSTCTSVVYDGTVIIPLSCNWSIPPAGGGKEHAIEAPRVPAREATQNSILTGSSELMIKCGSRAFDRCATRPSGLGESD